MPKLTVRRVVLFVIAVVLTVSVYLFIARESPEEQKFKQITVGMTVAEVEAILGQGTVMKQAEVMSHPVAVNLNEEAAFVERHRKAGTTPTAREYATRLKPVVEGDVIYHWQSGSCEIWVAFKDGKVCEKYLENWNYL